MSLVADLELNDVRVEFIADYALKTMKLKPDKWSKMYSIEEQKQMLMEFFEKAENMHMCIVSTTAGALHKIYVTTTLVIGCRELPQTSKY